MNLRRLLASVWVCVLAAGATAAFGQGFALPSRSPNQEGICSQCPAPDTNKKTVGYGPEINTFVGRWLDSSYQVDYQFTLRTLRAFNVRVDPVRKRFYTIEGSLFASYDMDSFLSKLSSGTPLTPSTKWSGNQRRTRAEEVLWPERYFYAESSSWETHIVDGQERLFDFDFDDRGNVYLAYSVFGWGIVKDEGTSAMVSVAQVKPDQMLLDPRRILTVKTSTGRYYTFVSGVGGSGSMQVWDTTNASTPVQQPVQTRAFDQWAKNVDGSIVALVDGRKNVNIFSADALAANQAPLATVQSATGTVACDGVNFYTTVPNTGSKTTFGVISPDGRGGYSLHKAQTATTDFLPQQITFSTITPYAAQIGGFITAYGYLNGLPDVRVFKVDAGGSISEMFLTAYAPASGSTTPLSYWKSYYGYVPPNYVGPGEASSYTNTIHRQNGKAYLIIANMGVGDVYELKTGDNISVTVNGLNGRVNGNAPAASKTQTFYGDPISFTSKTSAAAPMSVSWNFGNPEASNNADPNVVPGSQTGLSITHRYSGLAPTGCYPTIGSNCSVKNPRTVTATSSGTADPIAGSNTVQLQPPVLRVGVTGYDKYLVVQPNATSPIPIVVGDKFFDASDGTVESHFNAYGISSADYNDSGSTLPYPDLIPVGTCGPNRTLNFDAHYGYYSGFTTIGTDWPLSLHGFQYAVRPFAAGISVNANGNPVIFSNKSKVTTDATFLATLTPEQKTALSNLTYKWELVNASGNPVLDTLGNPIAATGGPVTAAGIPSFTVAKSYFSALGLRARLTITAAVPLVCGTTDMTVADTYTDPLNGPDFTVTGGCTSGGPPCNFSVTPAAGADTSDWVYSWSTSPSAGVNATATSGPTFSPVFTTTGGFTVQATVTNAIGSKTGSTNVNVTTAGSNCPQMVGTGVTTNVFITYSGPSGCSAYGGNCAVNEQVQFGIGGTYDFSCSSHTFTWNFGDGTQASGQNPQHKFTANASGWNVTVTITNAGQSIPLTQLVKVGGSVQPPPPNPPPNPPPTQPGSCGTMTPGTNVYVTWLGPQSKCSPYNTISCSSSEAIDFTVSTYNYNFGCATHTFNWNFGSGGSGTGLEMSKQLAAGTYNASVGVANQTTGQQVSLPFTVKVEGGGSQPPPNPPPPTGGCTLTQSSFYIGYSAASGCTALTGDCKATETIFFTAYANGANSCPGAAFSWDFGDTKTAAGQQVQHAYATGGKFNAKLTITGSGNQSVTLPQTVSVVSGSPTTSTKIDFTISSLGGNAYQFAAFSTPAGAVTQWRFDFGDGGSSIDPSPQHVFKDSNDYTITLTSSQLPGVQVKHEIHPARRRAAGR